MIIQFSVQKSRFTKADCLISVSLGAKALLIVLNLKGDNLVRRGFLIDYQMNSAQMEMSSEEAARNSVNNKLGNLSAQIGFFVGVRYTDTSSLNLPSLFFIVDMLRVAPSSVFLTD